MRWAVNLGWCEVEWKLAVWERVGLAGAHMQTTMNMRAKALRTGMMDLERAVMICFTALILPKSLRASAV